jgi:DNA-binding LacI/PurR family transcriptional regulator
MCAPGMQLVPDHDRSRAPTIRDVARHAGVGVGTVSRVLNASPLVSAETQERVLEAIADLGYRPSATARNLSLGRTQAIGVVAPFFTSPSVTERLRGAIGRLSDRGYDVVLFAVETARQRADAFGSFARRDRVDGLLVVSLRPSDEELAALDRDGVPLVLIDVFHPGVPHVVVDDVRGGELATEHLLAKGHRRIAFLGDAAGDGFGFTSSEQRRQGYRRALARHGVEPVRDLEVLGFTGRAEARQLAFILLRRDDRPTAVFAASDVQAIGVLEAAEALGLRVPEDVAVIGFDDIELAGIVGLTTVRQPLHDTGVHGVDLLLGAIDGDRRAVEQLEPLTVVERRTG